MTQRDGKEILEEVTIWSKECEWKMLRVIGQPLEKNEGRKAEEEIFGYCWRNGDYKNIGRETCIQKQGRWRVKGQLEFSSERKIEINLTWGLWIYKIILIYLYRASKQLPWNSCLRVYFIENFPCQNIIEIYCYLFLCCSC